MKFPSSTVSRHADALLDVRITSTGGRNLSVKMVGDDAINQLPASFRMGLRVRQIEDLDVGEVAERLGIPAATVSRGILRARRRLQRSHGPGPQRIVFKFPSTGRVARAAR